MRKTATLVSAMLMLGGSSLPGDPDLQSLTLSKRFAYGICTGVCPVYDLKVTPDGSVDVRQIWPFKEHFRFRVRQSAARAAIAKVSPFRSAAQLPPHVACAVPSNMPTELFNPKVTQFAIEWHGRRGKERLVACAEDRDVVAAFDSAIAALGAGPDGAPFVRQRIDGTRYGQRVSCDLGNGRWSPPRYACHGCPPESVKSSAKFDAVDLTHCRVEEPPSE